MSNKVTIKSYLPITERRAFITIDKTTYDYLAEASHATILLDLPKGLSGWTKGQGVALEEFKDMGRETGFILLLDNADQNTDKGKKFIAELRINLNNLGHTLRVPAYDPGVHVLTPLDDLREGGEISLWKFAQAEEGFATVKSVDDEPEDDETSGPKIHFNTSGNIDALRTGHSVMAYYFKTAQDSSGSNKTYAVPKDNAPAFIGRRAFQLGSTIQRQVLSKLYMDTTKDVLNRNAHQSIEDALAGEAMASGRKIQVVDRAYQNMVGDVLIDLGRNDCKCVKVNNQGWSMVDMPTNGEKVFVKTQAVREISEDPIPVGTPEQALEVLNRNLRPLFNVNDLDWPLIVGWMVNHLIAGRVSPILMMLGTGGSGKSTMCNAVSYAVEGGPTFPRSGSIKSDVDDVMVTISKKKVSVFDNVSKLSGELSDTLAQAVYGMDYEKRELRTTDDMAIIKINPSLILNGITTGHLREDLKSRMVTIRIAGTVPSDMQKDDIDIVNEQTANHPETYGALLTLVSAVLAGLKTLEDKAVDGRMKEYAKVLMVLDNLFGWKGLDRYVAGVEETAEDALEDPLLKSLVYLVRKNGKRNEDGSWSGLVGTLQLTGEYNTGVSTRTERYNGDKLSELSSRQLPDRLSRAQGDWKRLGVMVNLSDKMTGAARPVMDGRRQVAYPVTITPKAADLLAEADLMVRQGNGTVTVGDLGQNSGY